LLGLPPQPTARAEARAKKEKPMIVCDDLLGAIETQERALDGLTSALEPFSALPVLAWQTAERLERLERARDSVLRALRLACAGCQQGDPAPLDLALRPYRVTYRNGETETALYCADCAALAGCGWSEAIALEPA
jgi:hypothetical protein